MRIAIMQGRLVPPFEDRIQCFPRDRWREEFAFAALAGLDAIEWIYDLHGVDVNPINDDAGLALLSALTTETGITVRSVCADYFMEMPLLRASAAQVSERTGVLAWLLTRCARMGASRVVLPFVDASSIESGAELKQVANILTSMLPTVEATGVELHLETSLGPDRFADLLARVPHPMIRVNYDSGNSASLGYAPRAEFDAYGDRVGSVHIKDRVMGGGTVPLGTGDADLEALFDCLAVVGYPGDFVLQVARGPAGDEVSWARRNREYVVALRASRADAWT